MFLFLKRLLGLSCYVSGCGKPADAIRAPFGSAFGRPKDRADIILSCKGA